MSTRPPTKRPTRPPGWLDAYPTGLAGGDLYGDAQKPVAARWKAIAAGLAALGEGDPALAQETATRHAADLGLTFRVTGDDQERAWPLNAMPLVIGASEWAQVERGLIQRATLLERLAADIYGPQRLVKEGHLPAAVIAGSPFFARRIVARKPKSGPFLRIYSADLARGPRGGWRVLQDRVRIASGIGYALENRLAMSRTAVDLLGANYVRRLAEFFTRMREGMASACERERPRIALLTPGRFNQTYAEQAHLARYLGFPLVEGRDLSVIDGRLYVGTIAGPKRVDGVWRWINTTSLDPLACDARSQIGVPNLFDAWATGGVEMANWPGAEVMESPAFAAFMPRLCKVLLGEEPLLPNVATWWCGQAAESSTVAARFDELSLLPAFGMPVEELPSRQPVAGADIRGTDRDALLEALWRRPMDYCGQEIVRLSTTPAIIDGEVVPRPFTIRAFVARTADGSWTVMPGGFARLSSSDALPTSMMGDGDLSADVWIVDDKPNAAHLAGPFTEEPPISRGGGILASQAADNLFWFGRYNERAEMVVRIVRALLGYSMEGDSGIVGAGSVGSALSSMLEALDATSLGAGPRSPVEICAQAFADKAMAGSVATLIARRHDVGLSLRERFARDFWRLVNRPMPRVEASRPETMMATTRWLTEHFSALAGLKAENMVRSAAWRFLEMGQRLERAQGICRMIKAIRAIPHGGAGVEGQGREGLGNEEGLGLLLDLCDSQIVYRTRYLSIPMTNPVLDLVLLDPDNPRGLAFQVEEIVAHLTDLPSVRDDNLPEPPLRVARALLGKLQAAVAADCTDAWLADIQARLMLLSDEISARYFLQFDRDEVEKRTRLL